MQLGGNFRPNFHQRWRVIVSRDGFGTPIALLLFRAGAETEERQSTAGPEQKPQEAGNPALSPEKA
jgi:hypothetical protein